jgi:hypothetical protein
MKKIFVFGFMFLIFFTNAQEVSVVKHGLFKVNFLNPGLVYEYGLSNNTSLYSELSLGFFYQYSQNFGSSSAFNLIINEQFRYYYNFEKRNYKNKRTTKNSANYLAFTASNSFKPFFLNNTERFYFVNRVEVGPVWGLQRTYKGNFNLDLNFGVGATIYQNNNYPIVPIINFSMGWGNF